MNKEFIPYEQALELKELGFDSVCFGFYNPRHEIGDLRANPLYEHSGGCFDNYNRTDYLVSAPLYQQAFRWFREKYNILATIYSNASGYLYEWHDSIGGTHRGWSDYEGPNDGGVWNTYEEAELACLKKLIEIVKNK
jgi:hypothetical protein